MFNFNSYYFLILIPIGIFLLLKWSFKEAERNEMKKSQKIKEYEDEIKRRRDLRMASIKK